MEWIFILVAVAQSIAISLGVGSSTLAIINFFVAIKDGNIEPVERRMMGIVYVVLRIAMAAILITLAVGTLRNWSIYGIESLTTVTVSQWILVFVLYANAILMTKRIMSSRFGPALQASTWYTLGVISALIPLGVSGYSLVQFAVWYVGAIVAAIILVNSIMATLKS